MIYVFAIFLVIYVLCCLVLVGFILTQEGKGGGLSGVMGASMGETFGFGGATATIRKFTSIAATVFLVFTVILTFLGERVVSQQSSDFLRAGATESPAGQAGTVPGAKQGVKGQSKEVKVEPVGQPVEVKTEAAGVAVPVATDAKAAASTAKPDAAAATEAPVKAEAPAATQAPAEAQPAAPAPAAPAEAAAATSGSASQ